LERDVLLIGVPGLAFQFIKIIESRNHDSIIFSASVYATLALEAKKANNPNLRKIRAQYQYFCLTTIG